MIFKTIYYNSSHNLLINNSELIANATTQTVKYFDIPATAEEILITPVVIPDRPAPTPTIGIVNPNQASNRDRRPAPTPTIGIVNPNQASNRDRRPALENVSGIDPVIINY